MYSPGLPVLFIITAVNFFIIYWVDKWLMLRFYRIPKNYDETSIMFTIHEMKFSLIFHFFIGGIVFSNKRILSPSGTTSFFTSEDQEGIQSLFQPARYNSIHTILFGVGMLSIILLAIFERTIFSWITKNITCFISVRQTFLDMDAISDDYYEEITLKFLISEYERTK